MLGALFQIHDILSDTKQISISRFRIFTGERNSVKGKQRHCHLVGAEANSEGMNFTSDRPFQARPGCSPASPSPAGTQRSPDKARALGLRQNTHSGRGEAAQGQQRQHNGGMKENFHLL